MDASNKGPKTIATIDVNVRWPKVENTTWRDESIADLTQCLLCGAELAFTHKTQFNTQKVVEEAHCPHCKVRNRTSTHGLQ